MPKQSEVIQREVEEELIKINNFVEYSASFQRVFGCPDGEKVMKRLKGLLVNFSPNPYLNAYGSGIREVIELIERHCNEDEYKRCLGIRNAPNKEKDK